MKRKKTKKNKNIFNLPSKISKENLKKILYNIKKRKEKDINKTDSCKLQKTYSNEIDEIIEKSLYEKIDFFLYLKIAIKRKLETLIKYHDTEIQNHNNKLKFEESYKWILDKKSLMIALDLIKKVIVSRNDMD